MYWWMRAIIFCTSLCYLSHEPTPMAAPPAHTSSTPHNHLQFAWNATGMEKRWAGFMNRCAFDHTFRHENISPFTAAVNSKATPPNRASPINLGYINIAVNAAKTEKGEQDWLRFSLCLLRYHWRMFAPHRHRCCIQQGSSSSLYALCTMINNSKLWITPCKWCFANECFSDRRWLANVSVSDIESKVKSTKLTDITIIFNVL